MKFSVLIPTFNRRDVLSRTLSTVFAQEFPADEFEVIVVVDGSTDRTVEMLQGLQPRCGFRFINQPNHGLPAARNVAFKAAKGDLVLILDDDILCDPLLLRKHEEQHSAANNLVVFGPVPLHPDSPPGLVAEQWDTWSNQFLDRLERGNGCDPSSSFWVAASSPAVNRSISRKLLASLDYCDEAMKDCHEDWELGIRLWKAGVHFHFQPDAIAYHLYVKSDRVLVQQDAPLFARGEVALSRKHPEYRPLSMLGAMGSGSWRHRMFVAAAVRLPFSLELILRPLFVILNSLRMNSRFNRAGMRLLT
ncbi:MAG: glycosyltransferase family 2 protein, partial [Terracidiphilus sp.]